MAFGEPLWLEWHDASGVHRASLADGISIGRSPQNDITVDDPLVSRQHCTIVPAGAGARVDAHASTNGVEADGVQTKRGTLRSDSVLRVGSQVFRVRAGAMPATSGPGRQAPHPFTGSTNGAAFVGPVALEWQAGGRVRQHAIARPTSIGRQPGADIVLDDPAVSRQHCVVTPDGTGVIVDAAQSQNGVSVGGRRLQRASVPVGTAFGVGHTEFRVAPATAEMIAAARPQRSGATLVAVLGGLAACLVVGVVVLAVVLRSGGTSHAGTTDAATAAFDTRDPKALLDAFGGSDADPASLASVEQTMSGLPTGTTLSLVSTQPIAATSDQRRDLVTYELDRPGAPPRRVTYDRQQTFQNGTWVVTSMIATPAGA